ncbi:MAG: caspase family protein [Xenococcaceae cyanobacterium MO_167.B27]|nr:caspase family protein [Xenococcaceae cyanobacterium MO_167.B27]
MSRKVALLIGVSEYGEGIPSLSAPLNDVTAMKRVLQNPHMGGFDEVEPLIDPDPTAMRLAVQQIFANCHKDDLVLLFFSGHGITDDNNRLYLATKGTSKDFYKATSVPASFIQDVSLESYAKRQVIILDCCYSGAFAEGWQAKSVGIHLEKELGAEGRVVLTSSTATQTSFQQEDEELSLYTQYLVEGIETGAADKEGNGKIYAHELHDYAKAKVQEVKPKQKPEIIIDKEGFNILLSQAPVDDPELDYRKFVEKYATEGQITVAGNYILRVKRQELGITEEKSDEIVNEVLAPYRKRIENIKLYKQAFTEAVKQNYPLSERLLNELQDLEDVLGLEDKDIAEVKEPILAKKEAEYQHQQELQQQEQEEYENKLQQYEQEFLKAVEREYPLSENTRNQINILQQSLGIRDEDIKQIEQPILAAKYQEKLKEEERQRQKEQEAEKARQLELKKQQERKEYENKLQQYEQEFIKAIQAEYPLNRDVRDSLKNYQETLEITDEDITRIEQPILAQEETKYQEKLKEEERQRQRQQEAEKAKQLELQKHREAEKQEEKLKQQEAEHQRRLQQYEQKVSNAIRQGISPSHIRRELRQLQLTLGLTDSEVSSIEARLVSRQSSASNIPSPLPTEVKSFKSRRLLVGFTAILTSVVGMGVYLFSKQYIDLASILRILEAQYQQGSYLNCYEYAKDNPHQDNSKLQELIGKCGLEAAKNETNNDSYIGAVLIAQTIPNTVPNYQEVKVSINAWSENILNYATERYEKGEVEKAIAAANLIPESSNVYSRSQTNVNLWRKEIHQEHRELISQTTGVNYNRLRELLVLENWKEADQETARMMFQEEITKFPCEDLRIINQLWLDSSQEKFGFSVQQEIWQKYGSPGWGSDFNDSRLFYQDVGWNRGCVEVWKCVWDEDLGGFSGDFDLTTSRRGNLPATFFYYYWESGIGDFFYRIDTCNL